MRHPFRALFVCSLLAAPILGLTAHRATAFEMRASTWSVGTVTLYVNPDVLVTLPDHYDVLLTAESKVNGNASDLRFDLQVDNDVVSAIDDGESELNFTNDAGLLCGSLACAWVLDHGDGTIDEADVYFDLDYAWALDDDKMSNLAYDPVLGHRPLVNTALHEMLHTLGAQHENDCINILGNAWNVVSTNGDETEAVVSEDTTAGLVAVNGTRSSTINDVSVMHWKLDAAATGASAYSHHKRAVLKNAAGVVLVKDPAYDEPTYRASAGDVIQVEMTLENRGTATETIGLGVYWSVNSTISTGDTLLFSSNATLGVNNPFEHTVTVTIPAGAVAGQVYWVGAIIDRNGILAESNEVNNGAYIAAIEIQ
jgi:hypothetical protein